jgi:2-dehydro-3-deoxyphosphooctonate aldolase (KDO 8-P synthase)
MTSHCTVGSIRIGFDQPLAIIAGPCLLESIELGLAIGSRLKATCERLSLPYIFKASFDKANRTSIASERGPGLDAGLDLLAQIGEKLDVPLTTDLHEPSQAQAVARCVDLIQIPAFLCRQTDLLVAAAKAASVNPTRAINIKKGQFLSPKEMAGPIRKVVDAGCDNIMLTERGTFFGYHRLVNDFLGMGDMMQLGPPVCFDATHSTQLPGSSDTTGGRPERAPLLARAAVAAGVHALFIEVHPDPKNAASDGATVLTPDVADQLLESVAAIRTALIARKP